MESKTLRYLAVIGIVIALILLLAGLSTSPTADDSNIVNNHRLHIKNTLYLFSGIGFLCFFIAFSAGMIVDLLEKRHFRSD
ncbi:MAG TPA: hypothetical protein VHT73_16795 [Thermodesulfobacteriota bacterium]|nr:hypothetical protein [Thermodesulfobacteriota bacterium]